MRSAIKGTKVQIIYQLANLLISRNFFSPHLPFTNDIGTIQEERTISDPLSKYKHLLSRPLNPPSLPSIAGAARTPTRLT